MWICYIDEVIDAMNILSYIQYFFSMEAESKVKNNWWKKYRDLAAIDAQTLRDTWDILI